MLLQQYLPFTVLKRTISLLVLFLIASVATVLTVYGIETFKDFAQAEIFRIVLQQYLPFTVLKRLQFRSLYHQNILLQQYLPFTVLKRHH